MSRDVGAPTLCFSFHCDCNGGSHQEGLPGNGVPGPPLQDLSAVVLGDHSSCRDPLLCCAAQAVLSAWFGVVVLVPFSSLSPLYRTCHVTTAPLFYILSFPLALPEPCKCVHSVPLCVHVPPPHTICSWPDLPAHLPTRIRLRHPFAHSAMQTWALCAELFIMVLSLGDSDPLT